MDSGVRGTQHASRRGTPWGVKPANNVPASANHTWMTGLPLRPMLTMRNLWKRRNSKQVKVADTPGPKGKAEDMRALSSRMCCPETARRRAGSYGSLERLLWWNWGTPMPFDPQKWDAKMPAVRTGGRRQRNSQTPSCNGPDRVKDCQGKPVKMEANGCREEGR